MAFWGIEVKPGKPYTHRHDDTYGRLHISQATLDYGPSLKKCVVQCNVGKKAPILLCALLPEKIESCPLDLEFEEVEEVVFSVLGPKSVHLTGYFVGSGHRFNQDGNDTDSYGEDIGDTETEQSNDNEDEYEEDFIDDGDPEVFPPSPEPNNRDTEMVNNAKPKDIAIRRHLKKKYQVSDSEADEDDQSPANIEMVDNAKPKRKNASRRHLKKKYQVSDSEAGEDDQSPADTEMVDNAKLKMENATRRHLKKKYQVSDSEAGRDDQSQDFDKQTAFGLGSEDEDDITFSSVMKVELEHTKNVQAKRKVDSRPSGEVGEDKKDDEEGHEGISFKKKTDASEGDNSIARVTNEASDPLVASSDIIAKSGLKSTKKRKESSTAKQVIDSDVNFECNGNRKKQKKESTEAIIGQHGSDQAVETINIACFDDGGPLHPVEETKTDMIIQEQPSIVIDSSPRLLDKDTEGKKKKKQIKSKGINTNANREEVGSMMMEGENESSKEMKIGVQTLRPETSNANTEGKKKKKKMKSRGVNTNGNTEEIGSMVLETENESAQEMKILAQTSGPETSDRLLVEKLAVGQSDGRTASNGDKVSIYYTGRLKETGKVFDSNIGQKPLKLRLGKGRVIEGLEVGIPGMRIGDKRRLIIPPSLGHGADGAEGVPMDAWLIYEIELTNIR